MSVMALRLTETCPHCGRELSIVFRREMSGGPLEAALRHGDFIGPWRVVTGFDDLARLPSPSAGQAGPPESAE